MTPVGLAPPSTSGCRSLSRRRSAPARAIFAEIAVRVGLSPAACERAAWAATRMPASLSRGRSSQPGCAASSAIPRSTSAVADHAPSMPGRKISSPEASVPASAATLNGARRSAPLAACSGMSASMPRRIVRPARSTSRPRIACVFTVSIAGWPFASVMVASPVQRPAVIARSAPARNGASVTRSASVALSRRATSCGSLPWGIRIGCSLVSSMPLPFTLRVSSTRLPVFCSMPKASVHAEPVPFGMAFEKRDRSAQLACNG